MTLLAIEDLAVSFQTLRGRLTVIQDVSFQIAPGEILGVVGESGSGKSVTALAILGLLGEQGRIERGRIGLDGRDLTQLSPADMLKVRGREVAMIFQEPMTSLNPLYPVGFQVAEVLIEHLGLSRRAAEAKAVGLLAEVGIPAPEERARAYPHQLSGGMRQRVMIAIALACRPKLLLADEPTTALDVTIQAQILQLMRDLAARNGTAIMMITHDMGVIAEMADRVIVMYAGQVVETAPVAELFARPRHPYTRLLLQAMPSARAKVARLPAIPGTTPVASDFSPACRFHPRCPQAVEQCRAVPPPPLANDVRCWLAS